MFNKIGPNDLMVDGVDAMTAQNQNLHTLGFFMIVIAMAVGYLRGSHPWEGGKTNKDIQLEVI